MMSALKTGPILSLSLLAASALLGCHEPNQPQSAGGQGMPAPAVSAEAHPAPQSKVLSLAAYEPGNTGVSAVETCNLEGTNGSSFRGQKVAISSRPAAEFTGWFAVTDMASPRYFLRFDDKVSSHYFQAEFIPSMERPDVAAKLGQNAAHSGFVVTLDLNNLPAADYHVYLAATDNQLTSTCDNGRVVAIGH